jgi:hypothetical protein
MQSGNERYETMFFCASIYPFPSRIVTPPSFPINQPCHEMSLTANVREEEQKVSNEKKILHFNFCGTRKNILCLKVGIPTFSLLHILPQTQKINSRFCQLLLLLLLLLLLCKET